ncbi:MAG: LacI family DNA-binding transcriptional regulator [Liquorilactobacillus hordei]|mgnify:FL=1|uniref:LacI family DNA-binding transcriptional regulator n=1 Tax=Liquorilactobacillus hordei TaxID=468911 RepID=UPI0039EC0722
MITLTDVAKRAHVSTMTVSRVLHHPEQVSEEIRLSVQNAISELGYKPSRVGQALSKQRQFVIQFLILEDVKKVDPYYAKLLLYIADFLRNEGYTLEINHDATYHASQVDGTFVSGARKSDLKMLTELPYPIVSYGKVGQEIPYVDIDNAKGIFMITKYLISVGYQNIIYIGLNLKEDFSLERKKGYETAIIENKRKAHIFMINNDEHEAAALVNQLDLKEKTAIVSATDRIAIGVLQRIQECGIADVGVTGFDGVFISQFSLHKLTTVEQPLKEIARTMVEMMLKLINKENVKSTLIKPRIIIGETTRKQKVIR